MARFTSQNNFYAQGRYNLGVFGAGAGSEIPLSARVCRANGIIPKTDAQTALKWDMRFCRNLQVFDGLQGCLPGLQPARKQGAVHDENAGTVFVSQFRGVVGIAQKPTVVR